MNYEGLIVLIVITLIVLATLWSVFYLVPRKENRERTKPIICVCEEQGRVGVVLRKDYEAASKAEWQPYIDGTKDHDPGHISAPYGRRLQPEPVFVFKSGSPEYYTLMYYCFVERAEFFVPHVVGNQTNTLGVAWQHIHGNPWSGHMIKW